MGAVTILYFASAADRRGCSSESFSLQSGATTGHLRSSLAQAHPALRGTLERCRIAVNHEFVGNDWVLKAGDEVAVIPPVSGG